MSDHDTLEQALALPSERRLELFLKYLDHIALRYGIRLHAPGADYGIQIWDDIEQRNLGEDLTYENYKHTTSEMRDERLCKCSHAYCLHLNFVSGRCSQCECKEFTDETSNNSG